MTSRFKVHSYMRDSGSRFLFPPPPPSLPAPPCDSSSLAPLSLNRYSARSLAGGTVRLDNCLAVSYLWISVTVSQVRNDWLILFWGGRRSLAWDAGGGNFSWSGNFNNLRIFLWSIMYILYAFCVFLLSRNLFFCYFLPEVEGNWFVDESSFPAFMAPPPALGSTNQSAAAPRPCRWRLLWIYL